MYEMKKELRERVEALAYHLMIERGNENASAIEWDRNEPTSQFTYCLEDAEIAVRFLLRYEV